MNKEKLYIDRLNIILKEVNININQYNQYYLQYLKQKEIRCPDWTLCSRLFNSLKQINSNLVGFTKEAKTIVIKLKEMNSSYLETFNTDYIYLDNLYNKLKNEEKIINNLKNDILNLDTKNNDVKYIKKQNSILGIIISVISIILLITTLFYVRNTFLNVLLFLILMIVIYIIYRLSYM